MPYIKKDKRYQLKEDIQALSKKLEINGDLNYVLFSLAVKKCNSYNSYKNFIGELNECVAEIRRRLLAPYEDIKIKENGDV